MANSKTRANKRRYRRRRVRIFQLTDGACNYCGIVTTLSSGTIDHVIPRSRGGANTESNMVWACSPCNRDKADKIITTNPVGLVRLQTTIYL